MWTLDQPGLSPEAQLWQDQISALGHDLSMCPQRKSASGELSAVSNSGPCGLMVDQALARAR